MNPGRRRILTLLALILAVALPGTLAAQQDVTLQRVQSLMNSGRFTEARTTLENWERTSARSDAMVSGDDRARALYLRGALATEPAEAEEAFVGVVLSYPTSPVAPQALLRLGQALHTAGEHQRALTYLERLRSDYPGTPERETALLWLARTQYALGNAQEACTTSRDGVDAAASANVRMLLELERDRACSDGVPVANRSVEGVGVVAEDPLPPGTPPVTSAAQTSQSQSSQSQTSQSAVVMRVDTLPERMRAVAGAARSGTPPAQTQTAAQTTVTREAAAPRLQGAYAVQTGAFRETKFAESIAEQMRKQGFDVRIVKVQGSDLLRVRVGAFATSAEAAALGQRVRDAGFASMIVSDVQLER